MNQYKDTESDKTLNIDNCPFCGSKSDIYFNTPENQFKVCCLAGDSNYLGDEDVTDGWCPAMCQTELFNTAAEAIGVWNTRQPMIELEGKYRNLELVSEQTEKNLRKDIAALVIAAGKTITKKDELAGRLEEADEAIRNILTEHINKPSGERKVCEGCTLPLKDHQKADIKNKLRDCAIKYHGSQQLRIQLGNVLGGYLK